ncbi:MAG: hypothetical protein U1A77_24795 [Pirellulales bacterium]
MTDRNSNKPQGPPDFSGSPEIPLATRNWLAGLLDQEKHSVLWPVVPVAAESIGRGLATRDKLAVRVHAGWNQDTGESLVLPATLARQVAADGEIELTLAFDEPAPGDYRPVALTVGKLDLWTFPPLSLGELADPTVELAESESVSVDAAPAEFVGDLAAAGAVGEVLHAAHQRLDLHWSNGLLEIRLARPPRCVGQPVVVETSVRDVWGDIQTIRDVVSVEERITERKFAGYVLGTLPRSEPDHIGLEDLRINVRPLRVDDLPRLSPAQCSELLAGQPMNVMTTQAEGFELRAAAVWEDQRQAISSPDSTWLVRVATGKEVR